MHGKCQEMTPGRMCSFILPSQPGLLYVPAAYGEVLRADQAHILTQDRFYWNLYDNNFLFRLSKTQDHGMRQSREIEASISFFPHTVTLWEGASFQSFSINPLMERIATNSAQAPLIPKKFYFPLPGALANPCLSTWLPALWPLPLPLCHALDTECFWLWLCRERLGPSLQTVQLSLAAPFSEKNRT